MKSIEYRHIALNKVFSFPSAINANEFQEMNEQEILNMGGIFVRDYVALFDYKNDELYNIAEQFELGQFSDFKQAREAMKSKAIDIGYDNLLIEQIELLSKWFAVPSSISLQYFDITQISKFSEFFDENSKAARIKRRDCVIRFMRNVIPVEQLFPIIGKIQTLLDNYVVYGVEGSTVANINGVYDPTGIYDYINSTSVFEESGLIEESLTPQFGYTIEEVRDIIMDVFENGNYI